MASYKSGNFRLNTSAHVPQTSRLKIESNVSPGPGGYLVREPLANGVKFALSKRRPLFLAEDTPAPGSYCVASCFDGKKSYSFSPKFKKSVPRYPGPGAYDVGDLGSRVSGVARAARPVIGREKRKEVFGNEELREVPGPGRYDFRHTLAEGPRWKFGSESSRKQQDVQETPGPGSYEVPSTRSKLVFRFASGRKVETSKGAQGAQGTQGGPGPGQYEVKGLLRHSLFSVSRSEKTQKLSGPLLPGPGDYNVSNSSFRVPGSSKSIISSELSK